VNLSDTAVSLIRTYVPIVVGAFISWLVSIGVDLGAEANVALVTFMTAALTGAYYAIARALEKRWPILGRFLLGSSRVPEYTEPQADR
jgi:hypothetical protein